MSLPKRKALGLSLIALVIIAVVGFLVYRNRPEGESSLGGAVSAPVPVFVPGETEGDIAAVDGAAAGGRDTANGEDSAAGSGGHPLDPVLELARDMLVDMQANVRDYSATLVKRERIGGRLSDEAKMEIKLRCRNTGEPAIPLAVYLRFLEPSSSAGREVIWNEAERDGKLVVHEGGFKNWTRLTLDPTGMLAMVGNRYPITQIGMRRLAEKLIEKGMEDREKGSCIVQAVPDQRVGDRVCTLYQIVHPEKLDTFDFHIAQIFIDTERNIPLRYAAFMWPETQDQPPPLEEEFTFLDVRLNVGLSDIDFDPDNPAYDYP